MDRIIEVKVNGNYLNKDNKVGGVQHEANVTNLRIEFDAGWDGYAKKVTFWDANGENPVERTLTADLLEDITASSRIYLCPIPGEALAESGECTFIIDGYMDGKRQRSITDTLIVREAPFISQAGQPADPTPSQAEQLQAQIDTLMEDITEQATIATNKATEASASASAAAGSADNAAASEEAASESATSASTSASTASESARSAANSAALASTSASASADSSSEAAASAASAEAAKAEAQESALAAKASETAAKAYEDAAKSSETAAAGSASAAAESEASASASAEAAKAATVNAPKIQSGTWWTFDQTSQAYVDTGVTAQGQPGVPGEPGQPGEKGESGVYYGTNEPGEDYDVWIDPNGDPTEIVDEQARAGVAQLNEEVAALQTALIGVSALIGGEV